MPQDYDPISQNVAGVRDLIENKTNKIAGGVGSDAEGADKQYFDELDLPMTDEELVALSSKWENDYAEYEKPIKRRQEKNRQYYLGKQLEGTQSADSDFPIASNLLFEAEETFLPAALSKNPDPVVWAASNNEQSSKLANDVKTMLQYHADVLVLRRKLTLMTRLWSVDLLGILKHGWDDELKEIKTEVRHAQNFIFDPKGCVDMYGDFDSYLGERITKPASWLIEQFPKHADFIKDVAKGKTGTKLTYTEWWNDDYTFCTLKGKVLDKSRNPHFLYDTEETGRRNHFSKPKKPYTFLSVFSFGDQPHDVTGLIEQNIPNQNRLSQEETQINFNLSSANNSYAFSADNFNQQTAKQAAQARAKGNPILIPSGRPIAEAIAPLHAQDIPQGFFQKYEVDANNLRSSFGTQGITAQQPNEETTARGMILNQQRDSTRIGGGIGDVLEQVCDNTFNWWVQLYHVYYDEPHYGAILGSMKAQEYVLISSAMLTEQLVVSVAPDSLKPKDEITEMNQALQLAEMGWLDPKSLLTILNVPDLQKTIENTVLWMVNKQQYIAQNFPELAPQQPPQPPQGAPGEVQGAQPPSLGGEPANAALSQVQLPQISTPAQ